MCFCPFLESQLYTSLLRNELLRDDIDTLTVSSKIILIAQTIFAIIQPIIQTKLFQFWRRRWMIPIIIAVE